MKKDCLGVYLHSPFCGSKCGYCSFYSFPGTKGQIDGYLNRLSEDIQAGLANLHHDYDSATIYFGGGTPSTFPAERVATIIQKTKGLLASRGTAVAEITVEVNPADYAPTDLSLLREVGVTRLSVGVQSVLDSELKLMKRRHTFEQALKTLREASDAGFPVVSADLIYGLPNQTFASWQANLNLLFDSGINHLSLYELTLEEGTSFHADGTVERDEGMVISFLERMLAVLRERGFERYEISNYAKGGKSKSLHNMNYWRQKDYLGFGPSAVSTIDSTRHPVTASLDDYLGNNALVETEELSQKHLHFERIMLGFRTFEGVSEEVLKDYWKAYFSPVEASSAEAEVNCFLGEGYMERRSGSLCLSDKGFLLYNGIVGAIL